MKRDRWPFVVSGIALVVCSACSSSDSSQATDEGGTSPTSSTGPAPAPTATGSQPGEPGTIDGGGAGPDDASTSGTDAGTSTTDGGSSGTDAGKSGTDAGKTGTDAGKTGTDAGKPHDAGTDASGVTTVGGVPGGQAGPGTTLAGCAIFPPDNPWNVRVDGNVQIVTKYTQIPQTTALHADFGDFSTNGYGIPFAVVPASQPNVQTTFGCFANETDPGPGGWTTAPAPSSADCSGEGSGTELGVTAYPFFTGMKIEGNPAAGSGGTPGALPNDQHAIVLQQGASGCVAWEAWNCVQGPAPFNCANGAKFDLTSNTLRPAGWTSADAAGLSILAGLVRLSEVQAGAIHHAIRVTFSSSQNGYIPPATHGAGSQPLGSAYVPMGLRLRLKASVSIASYPAPAQVVLKAMQQYGLIVADNGSNWYFQGDSDDGWNTTAPDGNDTWVGEVASGTGKMHGSDFEVVYTGDPVATGL